MLGTVDSERWIRQRWIRRLSLAERVGSGGFRAVVSAEVVSAFGSWRGLRSSNLLGPPYYDPIRLGIAQSRLSLWLGND